MGYAAVISRDGGYSFSMDDCISSLADDNSDDDEEDDDDDDMDDSLLMQSFWQGHGLYSSGHFRSCFVLGCRWVAVVAERAYTCD